MNKLVFYKYYRSISSTIISVGLILRSLTKLNFSLLFSIMVDVSFNWLFFKSFGTVELYNKISSKLEELFLV